MSTPNSDVRVWIDRYLEGTITDVEMHELFRYIRSNGLPQELDERLMETLMRASEEPKPEISAMTARVEGRLRDHLDAEQAAPLRRIPPWRRALPHAGVLLLGALGLSLLVWDRSPDQTAMQRAESSEQVISPATDQATVRLSDGRTVVLDSETGGIRIDGDQIAYEDGEIPLFSPASGQLEYLTVETPRGGTFRVTLADGSVVWMNAESHLKYPLSFKDTERVVHLRGEAYFDVKKGTQPFRVISSQQTIEVLGTEFNVSAYPDLGETRTTLLSGALRVEPGVGSAPSLTLRPGEQSRVDASHSGKMRVEVEDFIDWKKGEFVFRDESAEHALKRIARWYDVEIQYDDPSLLRERFSGTISRYDRLGTVLDIVQEAGDLDFEIRDRVVRIQKKSRQ